MLKIVLCFYFITFSCVKSESCGPIDPEDVNLVFFKYHISSFSLNNIDQLLMEYGFDSEKETIIYAFDFLEDIDSASVRKIIQAYLPQRENYNLLVLDYGKFSKDNYIFDAVPNAIKIGKLLGKVLVGLSKTKQLDIEKITLIGFSLGAHLMGEVGRTAQDVSKNRLKISKIIGLDPASPAFYPLNPYVVALSKKDAEFVQIIHTDSENFGIPVGTGHVDFWPNGGKSQPNCPEFDKQNIFMAENQCSHLRSVEYFAESVLLNATFDAVNCDSWENFQNNKCPEQLIQNHLGVNANTQNYGDFYLTTNGMSNYSKSLNKMAN